MTVGASNKRLLSSTTASARLSALSLPMTPAWPGVNIHTILSSVPSYMVVIESAYMKQFNIFLRMHMESVP